MRMNARTWTMGLLCWTMGVGLWASGDARAQTPEAYAGTPTAERITAWLKSDIGRDRAWGAYYAAQTKDASLLPELVGMAEQWEVLPTHVYPYLPPYRAETKMVPEQVDRLDAMTAVLDAVILLDGRISAQGLLKLQGDFPAQTEVLLSRMPEPEVEPTLLTMVHDTDRWHQEQRHVAAALLAREQKPPAGFVASLMHGADVGGMVLVYIPGLTGSSVSGGGCEADIAIVRPQDFDWPQVGQYSLRTNIDVLYATSYRIAGRIQVARIEGTRTISYPHCYQIGDLNTRARLQIVAELLGRDSLDIQTDETTTIFAASTAEYERKLREFVAQEEQKFLTVETQLQAKGLVTADEIARGDAKPHLHLMPQDLRAPKDTKFALPSIDFHDANIVWGYPSMR
jgi:hypothetical protein